MELTGRLSTDIKAFRDELKDDDTIVFRMFKNKINSSFCGCVIFTETLVSTQIIDQYIVAPLIRCECAGTIALQTVAEKILEANEVRCEPSLAKAINGILIGDTVILIDGAKSAIVANSKMYQTRSVGIPETENAVNGPKEAFTELLVFNMGLIRRKVKNPRLKLKIIEVGRVTKTRVCITYIEGLVKPGLLDELMRRLDAFEIDAALDINYISELIRDARASPFKTLGTTERPDVVAAKLLEGRAAILCDGCPFALTLPFLFIENFQSCEDYYGSFHNASFTRILRYIAFFITISLPGLYVALISYHKEMIPLSLLRSIVSSRDAVPFPAVIEMVILLILFDLLREAGLRLPKPIGGTVSTVGAIVLGQSIVTAKIVSAEMIIIVAMCGITSFLTPKLDVELIASRVVILTLSATLGIYGYSIGILIVLLHMASLKSFSVPYLSCMSIASKDTYIRAPWWRMKTRPGVIQRRNITRFRQK